MQFKIDQKNIAAVVVLYNSAADVLSNIITYLNQVEKLYVVDNSTQLNEELILALQAYPHVHYHSLNGNKGVAIALNWAANQAILDGYMVLLTMDDDTRTPQTMILEMIDFWNKYPESIGILSGVHNNILNKDIKKLERISYQTLPYTMTSGNMLNLIAYQRIGGFLDKLFIDHVDNEYGLRLNANNYKVVELRNIQLDHNVGYPEKKKIGRWVIKNFRTHSPIRNYYFMRNGIYVACRYFTFYPLYTWIIIREFAYRLYISMFFAKNGALRIKMLFQGVFDGLRGQLGEYHR